MTEGDDMKGEGGNGAQEDTDMRRRAQDPHVKAL
jgi:hypothetical protein